MNGDNLYWIVIFGSSTMLFLVGAVVAAIYIGNRKITNLSLEHEQQMEESKQRFQRLVENSPVPIAVANADGFIYANLAFARLLGAKEPSELLGRSVEDFMHPDYRMIEKQRIERVVKNRLNAGLLEQKIVRLDGVVLDVKTLAVPIIFMGQSAAQVTFYDITSTKHIQNILEKTQQDLKAKINDRTEQLLTSNQTLQREIEQRVRVEAILSTSEKHFRSLIESSLDLITIINAEERLTYINPAVKKILGFQSKELIGDDIFNYIHPDDVETVSQAVHKDISIMGQVITLDFRIKHKSDKWLTIEAVIQNMLDMPAVNGIMITARDVTEKRKIQQQIEYLSFYDRLTGLHNRAYFEEEILRIDSNRHLPITLFIADVNGLKLVNDAFGHVEGDELLNRIAQIIKLCCRREDIIARWGGDEFALLLLNTPQDKAEELCHRISRLCRQKGKGPIPLSLAMGHATKNEMENNIKDVLKEAEEKMYRNKMMLSKPVRTEIISQLVASYYTKGYRSNKQVVESQKMARDMGKAIGLNDSELKKLQQIIEFCDIGNLAIDDKIVFKRDKLSAEEWKAIQRHSEIGYHIVQNTPETADMAEPILAHHEWWDGSGYPRGLNGEDIPLTARVVSIITAYDAMTQKRPYRRTLKPHQAVQEIKRCAGTQFDPKLAAVMEDIAAKHNRS